MRVIALKVKGRGGVWMVLDFMAEKLLKWAKIWDKPISYKGGGELYLQTKGHIGAFLLSQWMLPAKRSWHEFLIIIMTLLSIMTWKLNYSGGGGSTQSVAVLIFLVLDEIFFMNFEGMIGMFVFYVEY